MELSTTWIVVIIVVVLAIIFSNIMLLIQNNKPFVFPDSYEKTQAQKDAEKNAQNTDKEGVQSHVQDTTKKNS